ncbi:MAG: protein kinase [Sandaracinaceae bacterium]|nr:protein kinase [Sandaracinaceae bacterium]
MPEPSASERYEVLRPLGAGGMGEVLLARQHMSAGVVRVVVLKTMLPHIAGSRANVDMFLREAKLASSLAHPNVVRIYDVTEREGRPCIVMEYLRGADLSQVQRAAIKRGDWLSVPESLAVVVQAADGLAHAHHHVDDFDRARSIVHRDISPQNLHVGRDGVVKVLDFGIARAHDDPRTQTGVLRGKLAYMAPEQVDGASGRAPGPGVDQFALGVVLWELLTRRRLFHRPTPLETLRAIGTLAVPAPSAVQPSVPAALDAIVLRMLSRDPDARFASCAEAAQKLRGVLREASSSDEAELASGVIARFLRADVPVASEVRAVGDTADKTQVSADPTMELAELDELDEAFAELPTYVPSPSPQATASAPERRVLWQIALAGVALFTGAGLAAAWAWQTTAPPSTVLAELPPVSTLPEPPPTPAAPASIVVRFEGLPASASVEVDGQPLPDATYVGPGGPTPRRVRVLDGDRVVLTTERALSRDETIALELPSAPSDSAVATPAAGSRGPRGRRVGEREGVAPGRSGLVREYPAE